MADPAVRARLTVVEGPSVGTKLNLAPSRETAHWILGRGPDAPLGIAGDDFVSRENAVVTYAKGVFSVSDVPSSRNGTWVNGERLDAGASHELAAGDVVRVGRTTLRFDIIAPLIHE